MVPDQKSVYGDDKKYTRKGIQKKACFTLRRKRRGGMTNKDWWEEVVMDDDKEKNYTKEEFREDVTEDTVDINDGDKENECNDKRTQI